MFSDGIEFWHVVLAIVVAMLYTAADWYVRRRLDRKYGTA